MSGLTAALFLGGATGCSTQQSSDGTSGSGEPRVIRQADLRLLPTATEPDVRAFTDGSIRGSLDVAGDAAGDWRVRGQIDHPRLRCATYRMSLRFGSGDGACETVDWLTPALPLPGRKQCNNATLIHSGDGSVDITPDRLGALNCVRVTLQCTGACG